MRKSPSVFSYFDICFVLNINSKGWILEKICKVIASAFSDRTITFIFSERNERFNGPLPRAKSYFFAHYSLYCFFLRNYEQVAASRNYVWFTHPDFNKGLTQEEIATGLNLATHVFTPCSHNRQMLLDWGLEPERVSVPIGGANPEDFRPKPRTGDGAIGFVGAYYARKQPEKILQIVQHLPHRRFILVGPRSQDVENHNLLWHSWTGFGDLLACPNFQYVEAAYEDFPSWYEKFDVYCSTSSLEGGPIPLIEAMMSNVIPVVSDTGFARDVVTRDELGYVFPIDAPAEEIASLLDLAMSQTSFDVSSVTGDWSWEAFGQEIADRIDGAVAVGTPLYLGSEHTKHPTVLYGFEIAQARGSWTANSRAALRISSTEPADGAELYVWTSPDESRRQCMLTIEVNGGEQRMFRITDAPLRVRAFGPDAPTRNLTVLLTTSIPNKAGARTKVKVGWIKAIVS